MENTITPEQVQGIVEALLDYFGHDVERVKAFYVDYEIIESAQQFIDGLPPADRIVAIERIEDIAQAPDIGTPVEAIMLLVSESIMLMHAM